MVKNLNFSLNINPYTLENPVICRFIRAYLLPQQELFLFLPIAINHLAICGWILS